MPYGTGDFLGGLATHRPQALLVLALAETAGVIVALPAAAVPPGPVRVTGLARPGGRADERGRAGPGASQA